MAPSLREAEETAAEAWRESRVYEADATPGTPKFFATYPYSYMNAFAHVGHAYTMGRVDFFVRYQRMLGKRTLYPFGFHVTGTPIVAAANRVKEGEENQIRIMKMQGFTDDEIAHFADPEHWVRFFPKEWRKDVEGLGLAADWRREFHTSELNPHYDAFIRWQFKRLRDGGFVSKGRHPVIWCPKDEAPVADHDRYEGEGETPQEWVLYKMTLADAGSLGIDGDVHLVAATLRPDTVFGQTNVWVDADHAYVAVKTGAGDTWLVNEQSARDLTFQFSDLVVTDQRVRGADLLGLQAKTAATGHLVPVLPATFIRHDKGTGIVTSVPSDSPQDLLSLRAVQDGTVAAPPAVQEAAKGITLVPVIRTERYGTASAEKTVAEAGARDHTDAAGIAAATEKAYQAGFYEGVMLDNAGDLAGRNVQDIKDELTAWLTERGEAVVGYWPSGVVKCRCLTPSVVKIVENQWFANYGDPEWKAVAQKAMDALTLYPDGARKQFNHVINWLKAWACAREGGLGTRLPWDDQWIIESLSDSTIYMAYYTFAHLLEGGVVTGGRDAPAVAPGDVTDAFFDYVLHGEGSAAAAARGTLTEDIVEKARSEFSYWYPLDFRNSGKDLVQNHLTFMVFNHVAIWPDDPTKWPQGISVNGWVNVDGEKMSKSRGNFILLRDALDQFGVTGTRLALAHAGEGLDDANFDREFAGGIRRKAEQWLEFATATDHATRSNDTPVDAWFRSTLARHVAIAREAMDGANFRTAFKTAFFDLPREWQWYVKRGGGVPHADVLAAYVDTVTKVLTPLAPHLAEAIHKARGGTGFAVDAPFPTVDANAVDEAAENGERFVKSTLDDIKEILKVTRIDAKEVTLFTAPAWKHEARAQAVTLARAGNLNQGTLTKALMADEALRKLGKEVAKFAADTAKALQRAPQADLDAPRLDERALLEAAADFISAELGGAAVTVAAADDDAAADPAGKKKFATPGRPAIHVV